MVVQFLGRDANKIYSKGALVPLSPSTALVIEQHGL